MRCHCTTFGTVSRLSMRLPRAGKLHGGKPGTLTHIICIQCRCLALKRLRLCYLLQDQEQYWARDEPWKYQPVAVFAEAFEATTQGRANAAALDAPHYTAAKESGLDPLARTKCAFAGFS